MADDNINSLINSVVRTIFIVDDQQGKMLLKAFFTWFLRWKIRFYSDVKCRCDRNRFFGEGYITLKGIQQQAYVNLNKHYFQSESVWIQPSLSFLLTDAFLIFTVILLCLLAAQIVSPQEGTALYSGCSTYFKFDWFSYTFLQYNTIQYNLFYFGNVGGGYPIPRA